MALCALTCGWNQLRHHNAARAVRALALRCVLVRVGGIRSPSKLNRIRLESVIQFTKKTVGERSPGLLHFECASLQLGLLTAKCAANTQKSQAI
jgi:hypothetical protein